MPISPRDAVAVGGAVLAAVALGAAGWLALSPAVAGSPPGAPASGDPASDPLVPGTLVTSAGPMVSPQAPTAILVDVQGGVAHPGIVRLAPGARVADAIAAAGGYTRRTDLFAAATTINLAAALTDGTQVFVPVRGMTAVAPTPGAATGGSTGGLVNLNTASPEELEALPGIGPVTVQKIVAARTERPFASVEELVERDVIHSGQLEDIQGLVTV